MDPVTVWMIAVVVGLTLATLLLTGPGMWSEKWGWGLLERKRRSPPPKDAAPPPPPAAAPPGAGGPPEDR